MLLRVGPVPDRGKELAGFPFIPRPWETCRSFVSYGGQVATEAALLLQCEVSSPALALNSVNVRGGNRKNGAENLPEISVYVKYNIPP